MSKLYSNEYVYDKYLFVVDKFDKFFSYVSAGAIPLLLVFINNLKSIKFIGIFTISLSLFLLVITLNLVSWFISMKIFEMWVDENNSEESNKSINKISKAGSVLTFINIIFFFIASILAGIFIFSNISVKKTTESERHYNYQYNFEKIHIYKFYVDSKDSIR